MYNIINKMNGVFMNKIKSVLPVFISFFVIFSLIFSGCSQKKDGGLRYGFTTEPTTLDPLNTANTADGRSILFNVFEGLVKPDTSGAMLPCLAVSWNIEQYGLIYVFTLRDDVYFHDGSALTAQDVKFSLDTAIAAGFSGLNNVEEVIIQNEIQIRIILKSVDPDFLPYLTVGIIKANNTDREKNIIGSGPFFIESYTPQRNLVLSKFNNYWQSDLPRLKTVTITFFANFDSLLTALQGGSIDGAFITGSMAAQLDHRLFDIIHNSSAGVQLLALNNKNAPFDDIRVRRAFNYGIDIQNIIDSAFFGHGKPSGSPIIPGLSLYYEDSLSYNYDPETARNLLEQAGFNNANPLSFEITVPSNFTMHIDTAQVIAEQLEKIGVNASIKLVDWPTWLSVVYNSRNYQATVITLDSSSVSPKGFLSRYRSDSSGNFINFNNADFDKVYNAAVNEIDKTFRVNYYKEAQKIVTENAASVYIQDILYFIAFRGKTFSGALDYPLYVIDFASIYRID